MKITIMEKENNITSFQSPFFGEPAFCFEECIPMFFLKNLV